jgi:hypothetical protein
MSRFLGGAEIEAEEFADMPALETESEAESEDSEYANLFVTIVLG